MVRGSAIDFALAHPDRMCGLVLVGTGLGGYAWARNCRLIHLELDNRLQVETATPSAVGRP
jgi:pimeloyl-ACP methyl ester carboxylesterase